MQTRKSGLLDVYVPDGEGEKKACPILLKTDAKSMPEIRWLVTIIMSQPQPSDEVGWH